MKFTILFLLSLNSLAADLSIYSVSTSSDSNCCVDNSAAAAELSVQNDFSGWSMFYVNDAGGLSGYLHKSVGGSDIKAGLMLLPYSVYASPSIGYPEDRYSSTAFAPFIGIKYSYLSAMVVYYDSTAVFSSSIQTGVDINNNPVYQTKSLDAPSKSVLYMIGITIPISK